MNKGMFHNNIQLIDYLEFWVCNGKAFIKSYLEPLNFYIIGSKFNEKRTRIQYLLSNSLGQLEIVDNLRVKSFDQQFIIVTSSISSKDTEFFEKTALHGDFIQNISFICRDINEAYEKAIKEGAQSISEPMTQELKGDSFYKSCSIQSPFNDLIHTFVNRKITYHNSNPLHLFPGFNPVAIVNSEGEKPLQLTGALDHIATCVEPGNLPKYIDWYYRCMGFKLTAEECDTDSLENELVLDKNFYVIKKSDFKFIKKDNIGLKMAVLSNQPSNTKHFKVPPIQLVISEAMENGEGQIEQYIQYFNGGGVQHLAFHSFDIFKTVQHSKKEKLEYIYVPDSYYDGLHERFPWITDEMKLNLKNSRVLIDSDNSLSKDIVDETEQKVGFINQIFTKYCNDRPTLFFELIQRVDGLGFGKGNIIALFEALETEKVSVNK
ncbi:hypothetical protein CYY_007528 [Polysphondylium violaceum]|uniref:VOC domain-containing protein n=1 Tax=Polysphondylium violaceum TaxID=133409 RepID=A0A8J4PPM3_9MYCE|nr:hypothetical protein CYY_007528 [Polysphondylium violaceum]